MGISIFVPGIDWTGRNLGRVTPTTTQPIEAIAIEGESSVVGISTYAAKLFPIFTTERDIVWSVESGGAYASIDQDGVLTALSGAVNSPVTIRATSGDNAAVFAEKQISVTFGTLVYYDYLQSDGSCYLLTDGIPELYGGKIIVRATLATPNGYTFGAAYGSNANATRQGMYLRSAGDVGCAFGNKGFVATNVQPTAGKVYRVEFDLSSDQGINDSKFLLYEDATDTLKYTSTSGICYLNADISVFCYGYSDAGVGTTYVPEAATFSANKFYGLIVKDSADNILRNIVPCTLDGVPGLFDTIARKVYFNLGAGTLTAGND